MVFEHFFRYGLVSALMLSAFLVLSGCVSDDGEDGKDGEDGQDANPYTISGKVSLPSGPAGEGLMVLLYALEGNGEVAAFLESTMTDANGEFAIRTEIDSPNSRLAIEVLVEETSYFGFLSSMEGMEIGPVSQGVFEVVGMIVGSEGGRTVDNYTPEEITAILLEADAALLTAGTDLADPEAVRNQVLTDVGGLIADYSEGTYRIIPTSTVVDTDPPDEHTPIDIYNNYMIVLSDGGGETWDIQFDGIVSNGTYDAYDGMFQLRIDGLWYFPWLGYSSDLVQLEDEREVVIGPAIDWGAPGLAVTRKIYVSPDEAFARFAELLTNTSDVDITIDVTVSGNLGSDESTDEVQYSSDGNTTVDPEDQWLAMHWDSYDPALGFFFPGASPQKYSDNLEYTWYDVTIPAGQSVTLLHWGFQLSGGPVSDLADLLTDNTSTPPDSYYTGLTIAEAEAAIYTGSIQNVIGEAGAFAPFTQVTLENLISGARESVVANSDGSLSAVLHQTNAGDMVHVMASDGTHEVVAVEQITD